MNKQEYLSHLDDALAGDWVIDYGDKDDVPQVRTHPQIRPHPIFIKAAQHLRQIIQNEINGYAVRKVNYKTWAGNLMCFIESKRLRQECEDYCGGWPCPISEKDFDRDGMLEHELDQVCRSIDDMEDTHIVRAIIKEVIIKYSAAPPQLDDILGGE